MKEDNLVIRGIKGDDNAFYTLIDRNKEKLYRIAFTYFKNEVDSLEAVQETTYRAYKNIKKLKEPQYFDTWLVRILINYCIDELKRRNRFNKAYEEAKGLQNIDSDKLDIEMALEALRREYKDVIILKYFEDLTIKDIARIMDSPEGTVKTWIHRALMELKEILSKDGEFNV